jgi:hypothetical protein
MANHVHLLLSPEKQESAALLMKHSASTTRKYHLPVQPVFVSAACRSCVARDDDVFGCYRHIDPMASGRLIRCLYPDYVRLGSTDESSRAARSRPKVSAKQFLI